MDRKPEGWANELLRVFEARDKLMRAEAARLAVHLSPDEAKEGLIALLRDPDQAVVIASLHSIGDLRIESALPAVSGLLGTHKHVIKQEVARCLAKIGGSSGASAITGLLDVPRLPRSSQRNIEDIGVAAIPSLMSALMDRRTWVRRNAALLLGQMGDRRAVPSLMVALNDNDAGVRAAAVDSLGLLGGKDAAPGLMEALSDPDEKVRKRAAEAVGNTGDEKVVVPLISLFSDPVRQVRDQAVKALADMGDVAGEALIRGLMEQDPTVREHCARALSFVTVSDALDPLLKVLEDGDWSVRRYAAEALGKLGDRKAIPYLLGALHDPIDFVRERARQALDRIDPEGIIRKRVRPVKLKQQPRHERLRAEEKIKEGVTPEAATMELPVAYDVLGLDLGATRSQVRKSWQELMRKYHPDVVMDLPDDERLKAEEEAKRVNVAYQVLIKAIPE